MGAIKEIADGLVKLVQIEKVAIFCFTVVIIVSLIKQFDYSITVILYSLGIMIYFLYIGFHRCEKEESKIDDKDPGKTITIYQSGFEFQNWKRDDRRIKFIRGLSIFFLILGTIWLIVQTVIILYNSTLPTQ